MTSDTAAMWQFVGGKAPSGGVLVIGQMCQKITQTLASGASARD